MAKAEGARISGMWPYGADILGDGSGTPRTRAISIVLAAEAEKLLEVRRFRATYLGGRVLAAGEVEEWLKTRPENKGRPARWLHNIPVDPQKQVGDGSYLIPQEVMAAAWRNERDDNDGPSARMRYLVFATPDDELVSEPIRAIGGVLDTLRAVVLELDWVRVGLWTEAHAATFVLTGYAPLVPDVAFPPPARSGRRQTDKHLQLAAFTAQREAEGVPLAARLAEWNARFPQWTYKQVTNFGWDSRQAERRLLPSSDQPQGEQVGRGQPSEAELASEFTAEQRSRAIAEQLRQSPGKKPAPGWTAIAVPPLLEDAQAREEADKSKKGAG